MKILHLPATTDLLLLYPGESLKDQIQLWSARNSHRQIETSFERSLPAIRILLRNTETVLIDATEDPSQATDAFLQAVTQRGANAVTMYTERMHDGLEMFVRVYGSLFLLGPLFEQLWDELIEQRFRTNRGKSAAQLAGQPMRPTGGVTGRPERRRARFINRFRDHLEWPFTDNN